MEDVNKYKSIVHGATIKQIDDAGKQAHSQDPTLDVQIENGKLRAGRLHYIAVEASEAEAEEMAQQIPLVFPSSRAKVLPASAVEGMPPMVF